MNFLEVNLILLAPLKLGKTIFPINLIQGPLAGISCAPFRRLTWRYSKPAFSCTEMISCKTILHQPKAAFERYIKKDPQEGPVCYQLSGNDPVELAEAVKKVTDFGADLIDLNCGCPVKKIRSKGAGSRLLTNTSLLFQLISTMKQHTHVPVSIKIRVESHSDEKFNADVAKVVSDAGADFIIVHGRHWTEHYETPCRHEQIQFFVQELKIPVIGNGDIACNESLTKMFNTGCAGGMIGRAGVGQPWLIGKLIADHQQLPFTVPSAQERKAIFIEHVEELISLLNSEKFAILQARQFAKYYARGLENRNVFSDAINRCDGLKELIKICDELFECPLSSNAVGGEG